MLKNRTKREKSAWAIEAEARRKENVRKQLEYDRVWASNPRAFNEIIYTEAYAEALMDEMDRTHERWLWRLEWLHRTITTELEAVAKFRESLATNIDPIECFRWSNKTIDAAAKAHAAAMILSITQDKGPDAARAYATEKALEGARWPSRSSSAMANVAQEAVTAAFAEYASSMRGDY